MRGCCSTSRSRRLEAERRIRFAADDAAVDYLLEHGGWDPALGARPMRGAIQRLVEAPLAERILAGEFAQGDAVRVTAGEEGLTFVPPSRRNSLPPSSRARCGARASGLPVAEPAALAVAGRTA